MSDLANKRIALVHDSFTQWGGAENLVLEMSKIWPKAPIYTSVVNQKILPPDFPQERLITSPLQKIPGGKKLYQGLFFLHPILFQNFDFNQYDLVISSTTQFAKSIITLPQTKHFCYCNSPTRILWDYHHYIKYRDFPPLIKKTVNIIFPPIISILRTHDYISAQQVDFFIANSQNIAQQIQKFYHRSSQVIYPFADIDQFIPQEKREIEDYFLIVSRLVGHKRIDLAIEAFNELKLPLKIVGSGSERKKLKKIAGENIQFLDWQSQEKVIDLYQRCQAFIYPQREDFGITAIEAQASGRPVIAYRAGGALETVIENKTGIFFDEQKTASLKEAVEKFSQLNFKPQDCIENAQKFSRKKFREELTNFVSELS